MSGTPTIPELYYLHRYFTCVGGALALRMREGSSPDEDNLTFLLCELMDNGMTARHVLEYTLNDLNADLEKCGTGNRVEVTFKTHVHSKRFEGRYSFADLGIIFERQNVSGSCLRKAVLVQAKKLRLENHVFKLDSKYDAYKSEQFKNLKNTVQNMGVCNAAYYFLYNPDLQGIVEGERDRIRALETSFLKTSLFSYPKRENYPYGFGSLEFMPFQLSFYGKNEIDQMRDAQRRELNGRPGLRVCDLKTLDELPNVSKKPRLRDFYELRHLDSEKISHSNCQFETFADFMVFGLVGCATGSQDQALIALAEGKLPKKNDMKKKKFSPERVVARYTLHIKILSTQMLQD